MNLALLGGTIEDQKINQKESSLDIDDSFNNTIAEGIANIQSNAKVPRMQCVKFSGISNDRFCFNNLFSQFENYVANMQSNSSKLSYLRSVLTDYAFSITSHLTITDANYEIAVNLLKAKFLDNEYIFDEIFCEILNCPILLNWNCLEFQILIIRLLKLFSIIIRMLLNYN